MTGQGSSERVILRGRDMWRWLISKFKDTGPVSGFTVEEHVFEGAFSNIFRARRVKDGHEVALKVLTRAGEKIASMLHEHDAALWEGKLLKSLQHPNIVEYVDSGTKNPYWIAMEFIPCSLKPFVGQCHNKQQENRIIEIFSQIVLAVEHLHSKGLVHRDICLGNLLMDSRGTVKLIDFGMAVPAGCRLMKGRVGTPSYMAPEMIRKSEYTPAADIYSIGIVMYELITGRKPFKGAMKEQRMTRSLNVDPAPPTNFDCHCSPELERLVMKCISKDLNERPGEARKVEQSLFLIRHNRGLV